MEIPAAPQCNVLWMKTHVMLCNVQILQPCQDHAAPAAAAAASPPLPGRGAGQHQPAAAGAAQATQDWEWGAYWTQLQISSNIYRDIQ